MSHFDAEQKMEINSEAIETDEGISLEELNRVTRHSRRWTSSAGSQSRRSLLSIEE
jgi:hypothetical protein